LRQAVRDLVRMGDAARGIQPRPGGGEAGRLERGADVGRAGAGGDAAEDGGQKRGN
jgi:hypothetical protein